MTLAEAIAHARQLQDQADAGWPKGYDAVKVRAQTARLLTVFAAAAPTPEQARALVEKLEDAVPAW